MRKELVLSGLVLVLDMACGRDTTKPASGCDVNSFLYEFIHGRILERDTITCSRLATPTSPEVPPQRYVRYISGRAEVTYRDDVDPVRVVGAAPQCVLDSLAAPIPGPPLTLLDCRVETMREK